MVHRSGDLVPQEEEWPSTTCVSTHRDEHGTEHLGMLCTVFLSLHPLGTLEAHGAHGTYFTGQGLWHRVNTGVVHFVAPGI